MSTRSPHPLAVALIEALGAPPARVLELACGSGRNTGALRAAGFDVEPVRDDELGVWAASQQLPAERFDAALSTHGFLHGTSSAASALIAQTAQWLRDGAPLFATFASDRDARFGRGRKFDERSYAPDEGDEAGVVHVYFNERALRDALLPHFEVLELEERAVDTIVGRWAHAQQPAGSVHWFVKARRLRMSS